MRLLNLQLIVRIFTVHTFTHYCTYTHISHIIVYDIYIYIHMTIYADVHMHVKGSLNKIPETPRAYSLPYRDLGYAPEVPQVLPNHLTMSMFVSYYTVATYQCIHMLIIYNVDTYMYIYIYIIYNIHIVWFFFRMTSGLHVRHWHWLASFRHLHLA